MSSNNIDNFAAKAKLSKTDFLTLMLMKTSLDSDDPIVLQLEFTLPIKRKLVRRGFITSDDVITEDGLKVLNGTYESLSKGKSTDNAPKTNAQRNNDQFEEFWEAFPATDKWGGFPKTRVLRVSKERAKSLYFMVVSHITHEQLLGALNADLAMKKKNSLLRNELIYMPAITTWLSKGYYEGFLDESETVEKPKFGEDIE